MNLLITIIAFLLVADGLIGLANIERFSHLLARFLSAKQLKLLLIAELGLGATVLLVKYLRGTLS